MSRDPVRFNLRYVLPLLSVLAIAFVWVGAETARSQRNLLNEEVERSLAASAFDLASRSRVAFLLGDSDQMRAEIERTLANAPDARFGLFRDLSGATAASVGFDSLPAEARVELLQLTDPGLEETGYRVGLAPLSDGTGEVRGYALVGASTVRVDAAVRRSTYKLSAIAAVAFIVVALLASTLLARIQGLAANLERRVEERTMELAEARDRAMDASRSKSDFLANMSHEIRTPMHGVLAVSELLLTTELDEKQRRWTNTIHRSGLALLTIIDDVLDVSKIEAGRLVIELAPMNLSAVVQDVVDLQSQRAVEKGLSITLRQVGEPVAPLLGDAVRIGQITQNLVGNAIKFTERGEVEVLVQWSKESGSSVRVRVSVRDSGVGIGPAALPTLFDAFVQEDASTTRKFGGSGLGLAISKQLVELMGGRIGLESTPGQGSLFWYEVQLDRAEGAVLTSLDESGREKELARIP